MVDIVLIGTGGQARELHALLEATDGIWNVIGFIDDDPGMADAEVHGLPVLGDVGWLSAHAEVEVALGIGSPATRSLVVRRLSPRRFPTLIHPAASIGARVTLGEGVIVGANAVVTTDVDVGGHALLNFGCTVGHDAVVGRFATVAPGAHLSGGVLLGEGCDVGTGSSTVQGISIGAWSTVGAGAVVLADVPADTTVVGVPARPIKRREPGWQLNP